ncbi:MAG: hypothetical protein LBT38_05975 [Deltaproteobacteria bacterium]|nr:hypothetical protein [Deltaproteobacteria bacterium]
MAKTEGEVEASRQIANKLLLKGAMTDEEIAAITSLDLETVIKIKSKINN